MNPLLLALHAFDRLTDSITARYVRTGRLMGSISLLLLLPLGLFFVSIGVIQGALLRPQATQPNVPTEVRGFLDGLPKAHEIHNGQLYHRCGKRVPANVLARRYYSYSGIYERTVLEREFKARNSESFEGERCRPGALVVVPQGILAPLSNRPLGWAANREVRAIYMQGGNTVPGRIARELILLKQAGGNALIFDVKDIIGVVNYRSEVAEVEALRTYPAPIPDLAKTIRYLHDNEIYVIARVALFQDRNLAEQKRAWAIKNGNDVLRWKGEPLWMDPGVDDVQLYNLKIVSEMVRMGVDEIQFDYVRYPAEGDLSQVSFRNVREPRDKTLHLKRFLTAARMLTLGTGVRTAIDIFGIVAWGEKADVEATGQRIEELSRYVDVISPMLYPSHFGHVWDGIENPADHPKHFYVHGVRRVLERSHNRVIVRPWLQAFHWRVTNYDEHYVPRQIEGLREGGGVGWMLWNAGNNYEIAYRGMRRVRPKTQ